MLYIETYYINYDKLKFIFQIENNILELNNSNNIIIFNHDKYW